MSEIIFAPNQLTVINEFFNNSQKKTYNGSAKQLVYDITLDDLKSFKEAPNGMKWTKEEKSKFEKLSHIEKKKYLINKMGFKGGVILPNLTLDSVYKYADPKDDVSKDQYARAMQMLSSSNKSFPNMARKEQDTILNHLREASKRNTLIATKHLADLLLSRVERIEEEQGIKDLNECAILYTKLAQAGSPDGYYGYYALYRFTQDQDKLFYSSVTPKSLGINKTMAQDYLNEAIKKGQINALYDVAETTEGSSMALDMYITIGYLYQDRNAFYKAMKSASYDIRNLNYEMFYSACMRMYIILGGSLDELISCYANSVSVHKNHVREDQLRKYEKTRKLIDGLDPYFDELFPPDLVLDFGTQFYGSMYGGTSEYPGVYRWINTGKIKDPRDKDSNKKTIQDFYNNLWQIILFEYNYYINFTEENAQFYFSVPFDYASHLLYRKYSSGFASARPYIFPKEVLDTKIDFNKIPPKDLV